MYERKRLRSSELRVGDLVLLHTGKRQQSRVLREKLDNYWRGPYRIREVLENSTFYYLEELDGTPLAKTIARNRLKKFFSRRSLDEGRDQLYEAICVRDNDNGEEDSFESQGREGGGNEEDDDQVEE